MADKIDRKKIEEEYGLSFALFKSDKELMKLLRKATNQNWTPNRFQVELRNTDWFQNHSAPWRQNMALKHSDPTTYEREVRRSTDAIQNMAGSLGVPLSWKATKRLGERAFLFQWNEGQIRNHLANFTKPAHGGQFGGELGGIENNLRQIAYNNGVRVGDKQMKRWMQKIVRGGASQENFENFIRKNAAQTFGAYGEQIEAGMDVADIAAPYMQSMSEILEINPGEINLFDRTIRKALSAGDPRDPQPMAIGEFEDSLRQDRRWQYTKQAKDTAKGFASSIASAWGLV